MVKAAELSTPSLLVDGGALDRNLRGLSGVLPGERLRPHVKAHKCTALAAQQAALGHETFTCATPREMVGMAAAGLGADLLLANEVVDPARLRALADLDARVTVAIDSRETLRAAAAAGIREVLVDVNVGLPRCGCLPEAAGKLAEEARGAGLLVRGVMGYEGHVVGLEDREKRARLCAESMDSLLRAHRDVGGEVVSAGGTGTFDLNTWATEIQAGSYALMDSSYGKLGLPFEQALFVLATIISVSEKYVVADCGLKALGMDHGDPTIPGAQVWFCSDEHITFAPAPDSKREMQVGSKIRIVPAHVDPTAAYHERLHVVEGEDVLEVWEIDLRGW